MIYTYCGITPEISESVFIAPSADIIGDVVIGADSSVWFNVTIRGDVHFIRIGSETNIQDNSLLHVTNGRFPLNIGNRVTIAHQVVLHGCTIEDNSLIGMGAIILDGVTIGSDSIVAAGSIAREGKEFPSGVLVAGFPAEIKRKLRAEEIEKNRIYSANYVDYKRKYMIPENFCPSVEDMKSE